MGLARLTSVNQTQKTFKQSASIPMIFFMSKLRNGIKSLIKAKMIVILLKFNMERKHLRTTSSAYISIVKSRPYLRLKLIYEI
tara:strand:- start:1094 stop:1342 length:249 start_codon:yes stop_codon:yes gene_type:complete